MMIINKRNRVIPNGFQNRIDKILLVSAMVPLTQIASTIGILRRRLHLNIVHAAFAFESLVRVTLCVLVQCEQVSEFADAKVSLDIFLVIYHTTAQCLFVRLSLENLFF
jgi:hypothetical protein